MPEFSEYVCSHCDMKFTVPRDKKPRCPTCLRSQGIIPVGGGSTEPVASEPIDKKRVGLFLVIGLVIVAAVGGGVLFLVDRGKGRNPGVPTNLMAAIRARGVELPASSVDLVVDRVVETHAARLVGSAKGKAALDAVVAGVRGWVSSGKLTLSPPTSDVPEARTPSEILGALGKGTAQTVSSFQLATLSYTLIAAAGLSVELAERRDGRNQASLFARKRFGVIVKVGGKERLLDPASGKLGDVPSSTRRLTALQGVAYGLAFRAITAMKTKHDERPTPAALRRATSAIIRALKLWPNGAPLLYVRGQLNLLSGMLSYGVRDFKRALAADPDAAAHYNVGVALLQRGQRQNGIVELEKAKKLDPEFLPTHVALARAQLQQLDPTKKEELKSALTRIETSLEETEKKAKAQKTPLRDLYLLLGQLKLLRRDASAAVTLFRKEIALFPANESAYFALAQFYLHAKKFKEGAELAKRLVSHAPKSPRAQLLLAQFLFAAGEIEAAGVSYRKALALDPALPQVRLQLAQLLLRQKRTAAATKLVEAELKRFPSNLSAYVFLAVLYKGQGRDKEANQLMQRALARTKRKKELKAAFEKAFKQLESKRKAPAPVKKAPAPEKKAPAPEKKP
ncbi:MAG: tetratricopeptide repeat protein [Myxococcales bacterium]|nr:tetratricopeptide repeat protein [Myxococcales bacterium]